MHSVISWASVNFDNPLEDEPFYSRKRKENFKFLKRHVELAT